MDEHQILADKLGITREQAKSMSHFERYGFTGFPNEEASEWYDKGRKAGYAEAVEAYEASIDYGEVEAAVAAFLAGKEK